ncbi:MAG: hypothetical protein RL757_1232 [Bacteroidota bacterium]|jgi:sigma-B regulation protein RsbU (phosphoserine phosphatase)
MSRESEEIKDLRDTIRGLERQLSLTRLQVNRLLNITEAVNNNVKEAELFQMYAQFLNWELNVQRLMLFVTDRETENLWRCVVAQPVMDLPTAQDLTFSAAELSRFERTERIEADEENDIIKGFDAVIPVAHKGSPIAYAFIGNYDQADPGKVQIIIMLTNVIAVAIENKRLFKRQVRQEYEMRLAREMQRKLIPDKLPVSSHFEISTFYRPHSEVGGDFLDVVQVDEHRFLFSVADIAGKGLAAAMLMANFEAAFRVLVTRTHSNDDFIQSLNHAVNRITRGDSYITFFVAQFNSEKRKLKYVNAGHVAPVLVLHCNQPIEKREVILLDKRCAILGFFEKLPKVETYEIHLDDDALLCIFTDGVNEVRNVEDQFFGDERLYDFIKENSHLDTQVFNDKLIETLQKFKTDVEFPDDITVLTTKLH